MRFAETLRTPLPVQIALLGVVVLATLGLWLGVPGTGGGVVAATQTLENGAIRAVSVDLGSGTVTPATFASDNTALVIAAVPNLRGTATAFVTRAKGAPRTLSIAAPDGSSAVTLFTGEVELPTWSQDGRSVAFAVRSSSSLPGDAPEGWQAQRGVLSGDTLLAGIGYHPYPAAGQQTFALTSSGVVLLTLPDTPPTIVVASPVQVFANTPFAVSQDGTRLAWVAPADHSLQVFEYKDARVTLLLLSTAVAPDSLTFSPDGKEVLGASYTTSSTTLTSISVDGGTLTDRGVYDGFLKLHVWR